MKARYFKDLDKILILERQIAFNSKNSMLDQECFVISPYLLHVFIVYSKGYGETNYIYGVSIPMVNTSNKYEVYKIV